jgi:hypothetical protein
VGNSPPLSFESTLLVAALPHCVLWTTNGQSFFLKCRGYHAQGVMAAGKMGNPIGLPLRFACGVAAL